MKVIDTKPGEQALCLNRNEILESSTVIAAYMSYGATRRRAHEWSQWFFHAIESLTIDRREKLRKQKEQGKRLGSARAAQLKQQRADKVASEEMPKA